MSAKKRLVFGLAPASAAKEGAGKEAPSAVADLAAWITQNTGVELEVKVASSYKELATSVREGTSDVAWLPPVVYAWLAEAVTPIGSIVREGKSTYTAALIVRDDSPLKSVVELKGARAGWVDPWSAAGFVIPRIELARARINPAVAFATESFFGSHRDAVLALSRGECDVVGTYARQPSEDDDRPIEGAWTGLEGVTVRVLTTFGAIPSDVLATRRNLEPSAHTDVASALRSAFDDESGRALARAVFGAEQLKDGIDEGHEDLRLAYETAVAGGLFD